MTRRQVNRSMILLWFKVPNAVDMSGMTNDVVLPLSIFILRLLRILSNAISVELRGLYADRYFFCLDET